MPQTNYFSRSSKYYDVILGKKKFERSASFIARYLRKLHVKSILELGCGTGLYLIPLKKAGFDIEGIDISKEMLAITRKKNKNIKLYQQDMAYFNTNKKYDAIICLNSSLILLPNFKLIEKTITSCHQHLKAKGVLILDLPNHEKEIKESTPPEYKKYVIPGGTLDVVMRDYKEGNKWVSEWQGVVKQDKRQSRFKEYFEELIYSPLRLEKSIRLGGFKIMNVFGSREGGTFSPAESYRRVYVCQRQ